MSSYRPGSRHVVSEEDEDKVFISHSQSGTVEAFVGAIKRREVERVEKLLDTYSYLLEQSSPIGQRPLMVALAEGHAEIVNLLLKRGADYSITDMSGNSPLHVASGKGNYEALKVFLKQVQLPDINCQNKNGDSVLMLPAAKGFSIVVECLLEHDADPNIANKDGRTPLMEAASKGHKDVVKVLLRFEADVLKTGYEDFSGMPTVLKEAISSGSQQVISLVMEQCTTAAARMKVLFECKTTEELDKIMKIGCSVNHQRGDGCTALMIQGESGNLTIVKRLLDAGALVDIQDKDGQTALMKCSFRCMLLIVRELIWRGGIIDLKCKKGRTALMYGVMGGSLDVTKELIMAGANTNLTDAEGRSASDLSESPTITHYMMNKLLPEIMDEDPFTKLMGNYLTARFSSQPKAIKETPSTESPHQGRIQIRESKEGRKAERELLSDEEDPLRKHLNTYIKRVAELETRVEELTIQTEFAVMDDEDLSHYETQPQRLIEEYKKLRASKKKAEQFAVEAKQSAQKASVELTQLKEQLLMETHINELKVKQLVLELEETLATTKQIQERREEIEKSYQDIIKAVKSKASTDVISHMEVENMTKHVYSPEEIFNMIINGNIKTSFKVMLVGVSGLPDSGKTTLIDKLIPQEGHQGAFTNEIRMFEAAYASRSQQQKRLVPQWEEFTREKIYYFMLIQALTNKSRALPSLEKWCLTNSLPKRCLTNEYLYKHFKQLYDKMQLGLLHFANMQSEERFHIVSEPTYVLLNLWDIAFKKSLLVSLPLIARLVYPFILINVLDLKRDGREKLCNKAKLTEIKEKQHMMRGRSRGHYFVRTIGLSKYPGKTILIGTHCDQLQEAEVERARRLTEAGIQAKAGDVGASKTLTTNMLAVNLNNERDIDVIKQHIEDIIEESRSTFEQELHLSWIFLRSALITYKSKESDFRMPFKEFSDLAFQCGLKSEEEIMKCLIFYTRIGSLMYSPKFFPSMVIYNPQIFFTKLNKLFESVDGEGDSSDFGNHCRESLRLGIICKTLIKKIWPKDWQFFWELMQKAGIAIPTTVPTEPEYEIDVFYDYKIKCPYSNCKGKELLYMSTLCTERFNRDPDKCMYNDSLYVTFNTEYMPGDIQAQFVKRMKLLIPQIQLKLNNRYNLTEFEFDEKGIFQIIVHGDVVELVVKGVNERREREVKGIIKTTCVQILDSILKYFPGCQYQIALICPNCRKLNNTNPPNNNITSYLHFLPTDYASKLYCRKRGEKDFEGKRDNVGCGKFTTLSAGQLKWMTPIETDAQNSTTSREIYESVITGYSELVKVVELIPLDCYYTICNTLGEGRSSRAPSDETIVTVLMDWQKRGPSNRREKLARILLRMGCYKAAIKLDPKVHYTTMEEIPSVDILTPTEIEIICNCAINWKQLAHELGLSKNRSTIKEIEEMVCTSDRERCRKVLLTVSKEQDGRQRVTEALKRIGWTVAADGLKCGNTNTYGSNIRV